MITIDKFYKKVYNLLMNRKIFLFLIPVFALVMSCPSTPKSADNGAKPAGNVGPTVSREQYDSTKEDVQQFIGQLNEIIRRRNFNAWKNALSPEYLAQISSPANLRLYSEQPAMKTRNITLRNAEDYFIHVVAPSRANSRVDDIEFIDNNRVKAFTVRINKDGEEEKLLLYNLERSGSSWKIIS